MPQTSPTTKPKGVRVLLYTLLTLAMTVHHCHTLIKCKRAIINNFYLVGLPISIVEPMHICPHVHDKCCSLGDEIKIKHLVEKHTQPILDRRVAFVMRSFGAVMDSFMEIMKIDPALMVVKYPMQRKVYFKDRYCYSTPRALPNLDEEKAFQAYHRGIQHYVRNRSLNKFLNLKPYKFKMFKPSYKRDPNWRPRRCPYHHSAHCNEWYAYEYNLKNQIVAQRIREDRGHVAWQNSFQRQKNNEAKAHYDKRNHHPKKHLKALKKPSYKHWLSDQNKEREFTTVHRLRELLRVHESSIITQCHPIEEVMWRDFMVVNQEKVKYCYEIHDKFMDMNLKLFISYLSNVKMSLYKITSMKNTVYCSICDAHQQQYFREEEEEIVVSKTFCRNLLVTEKDYFTFMHIIMVEFLNQLLQYLACFETNGQVFDFPFPSFMVKYTRRIKYVKRCLSTLNKPKDFYKMCYMMCRQFSLMRFSGLFEGDLELFKRVNVSLHSFLRKYRRGKKIQDKIDDQVTFSYSRK